MLETELDDRIHGFARGVESEAKRGEVSVAS